MRYQTCVERWTRFWDWDHTLLKPCLCVAELKNFCFRWICLWFTVGLPASSWREVVSRHCKHHSHNPLLSHFFLQQIWTSAPDLHITVTWMVNVEIQMDHFYVNVLLGILEVEQWGTAEVRVWSREFQDISTLIKSAVEPLFDLQKLGFFIIIKPETFLNFLFSKQWGSYFGMVVFELIDFEEQTVYLSTSIFCRFKV